MEKLRFWLLKFMSIYRKNTKKKSVASKYRSVFSKFALLIAINQSTPIKL